MEKKYTDKNGKPLKRVSEDRADKPISDVYPVIDNDLARDNVENDMSFSDLQDL